MKNPKKFLHIVGYIALAVLLIGIVVHMFYWTTDLEIDNWAVVSADGEIIETQDMDFYLRIYHYLYKKSEYQMKAFDQPEENRYEYLLPNGDPELRHHGLFPYTVVCGFYRDKYSNEDYLTYFAISMERGLFIAKHPDTEYYLIGSADANYSPKDILSHFSAFIDIGCQLPR